MLSSMRFIRFGLHTQYPNLMPARLNDFVIDLSITRFLYSETNSIMLLFFLPLPPTNSIKHSSKNIWVCGSIFSIIFLADSVDNIPVGLFGLQRKTASHPSFDSFNMISGSCSQFFKGTNLIVAPNLLAESSYSQKVGAEITTFPRMKVRAKMWISSVAPLPTNSHFGSSSNPR